MVAGGFVAGGGEGLEGDVDGRGEVGGPDAVAGDVQARDSSISRVTSSTSTTSTFAMNSPALVLRQ
jgi:hypothetical protein